MGIIAGISAFLVCFIGLSLAFGPTRCSDGWASPSIGRQGACSHHGGVDHAKGTFEFLGSLVAAAVVGSAVHNRTGGSQPPPRPPTPPPSQPARPSATSVAPAFTGEPAKPGTAPNPSAEVHCPRCGAPMRRQRARHGKYAGRQFWGCSRFPSCRGIRNL